MPKTKRSKSKRSVERARKTPTAKPSRALKLTAIFYSELPGVADHVEREGRLPPNMKPAPWGAIAIPVIAAKRGIDPKLTRREREVMKALAVSDYPAGSAILLDEDDDH